MPELPEVEITARRLETALRGAIIEAASAPGINALKTFDIVYVLTNGAYDTDVIATQMFRQLSSAHYSRAAAVGVVLFLAIVPLLVVNIRRFQQQEELR